MNAFSFPALLVHWGVAVQPAAILKHSQGIPSLLLRGGRLIHLLMRNHPGGRRLCNPEAFPNQLYPRRVRKPDWSEECLPLKFLQLPVLGMISHRSQRRNQRKNSFLQSPSAPWALRFMKIMVKLIQEDWPLLRHGPFPWLVVMQGPGRRGGHWGIRSGVPQRKFILKNMGCSERSSPAASWKRTPHFVGFPSLNSPSFPSSLPLFSATPTRRENCLFPVSVLLQVDSLGLRIWRQTDTGNLAPLGSYAPHLLRIPDSCVEGCPRRVWGGVEAVQGFRWMASLVLFLWLRCGQQRTLSWACRLANARRSWAVCNWGFAS